MYEAPRNKTTIYRGYLSKGDTPKIKLNQNEDFLTSGLGEVINNSSGHPIRETKTLKVCWGAIHPELLTLEFQALWEN